MIFREHSLLQHLRIVLTFLRENGWTAACYTWMSSHGFAADMQAKIDDGSLDLDYVIINNTKDYSLYRGFVGIFHTWDCLYYNGEEWVFGPFGR